MRFFCISIILSSILVLSGCGQDDVKKKHNADNEVISQDQIRELSWDDLVPKDYWFEEIIKEYEDIDNIADDDPRVEEMLKRIKDIGKKAPVVKSLDGEKIKIAGFVVPIDLERKKINEFLLVPYYGACIHVPPPPANQTIHVLAHDEMTADGQLFYPVWVSGTITISNFSSSIGDSGYRLEDASIMPYDS